MSAPVTVAAGITALLRTMPDPTADDSARAVWLAAKADLLERVADAATDPRLADEARACAAAARASLDTRTPRTATTTSTTNATHGGVA